MARVWWLPAALAFACSCGDGISASPAGWLSMTLTAPTGGPQCSGAASAPYEFGSAASPLVGQALCTVHSDQNDAWVSGHLGESRTNAGGDNLQFTINTQQTLSISFATDLTGTLQLDPNAAGDCAPTATVIINNAASVDFDCPLLVDPNDATSGCGVAGTVSFENCSVQ